ncbi:MAG: lipocalin-like domain-containing protein [Bacteroidaceae bacterium]|nr:lipocalin-like domain-containing protein [Bacteroidaceae bacterium]
MKRIVYICTIVVAAMSVTGCDKWDCNGDLDGMWQLTEWRDKDNNVKATKEDMIFYCFQLQMALFQYHSDESFMRSSLEVSPDQIRIYDPIEYGGDGHDVVKPMSVLSVVGVPEDGIFKVKVLTGSKMELETNVGETLVFRKY